MRFVICSLAAWALLSPIAQSDEVRTERVRFNPGQSGTEISASLTGYQSINYVLGASAGQTMSVSLSSDNLSNYFNLYAPRQVPGQDAAFYVGSVEGNDYSGTLPSDGDYTIQVYLMRNAARREETANFRLSIVIASARSGGDDHPGQIDTEDARIAGTPFHATGQIPCAKSEGQPMGQCRFGVIRHPNGSATVQVFWQGQGNRKIYFKKGEVVSSDKDGLIQTAKSGGLYRISIGREERYEIPEAVVFGG